MSLEKNSFGGGLNEERILPVMRDGNYFTGESRVKTNYD